MEIERMGGNRENVQILDCLLEFFLIIVIRAFDYDNSQIYFNFTHDLKLLSYIF